jgi:hypothetical protein
MKAAERLKLDDFSKRCEKLLRELLSRVPSLKLVSLARESSISSDQAANSDQLAQVKLGNRKWTLVVEEKRLGQPREVRTAVLQLQGFLKELPGNASHYGLLLAPFISEESARICADAGIGYADLAGNAHLAFDTVYIETRTAGNPFHEKREVRALFAPRAARVLRALLLGPLRSWKVTELAKAAQVSLGWVSAVRQQLLAREWAEEATGGLRVTKPGAVLDAWVRADDWEKRTQSQEYSVLLTDPEEVAEKLKSILGDQPPVFTQWFAGWLRHPHTTPVVVTAYVKAFPDETHIRDKLLGRRVSGGGGLKLVVPKDEGVFHPSQTVGGFELVSDVQIYLDLQQAGLRGEEQAAELKRWPDFAGGWS